jgi:hypothetical protein
MVFWYEPSHRTAMSFAVKAVKSLWLLMSRARRRPQADEPIRSRFSDSCVASIPSDIMLTKPTRSDRWKGAGFVVEAAAGLSNPTARPEELTFRMLA